MEFTRAACTDKFRYLITSVEYPDNVCVTVGEVCQNNPECGFCKWFEYCTGGCYEMVFLCSGEKKDFCGGDTTKCRFFENGWYEKM